ncbi:MAG: hypothetical protein PHC75_00685 [Burkholderiales bacterium]|nr:hypothetical protein [Burkholderiales bacterium]
MIKKVAWMHYPIDDLNANTLTNKILNFHEKYNFDFIKVSTNSNSICNSFGINRSFCNSMYGSYAKNTIPYDPNLLLNSYTHLNSVHDFSLLSENIIAHKYISSKTAKPTYATVYSPIYHLKSMLGDVISVEDVLKHHRMLSFLTKITKEYILELQKIPHAKIYYCVFVSNNKFCNYKIFQESIIKYDKECIDKIIGNNNIIHFHKCQDFINEYVQLGKFKFISSDTATDELIQNIFNSYPNLYFIGGLNSNSFNNYTELINRLDYLKKLYYNKNFIIGPDCTLPINIEPTLLKTLANYE